MQGTTTGSITFVTFTHTGHFTGTFMVDLPGVGTQSGTFAGRVTLTRHLFVTVTGPGGAFTGTLTAYATHTGKIISVESVLRRTSSRRKVRSRGLPLADMAPMITGACARPMRRR